MSVSIDGIQIGNWIYSTLTEHNKSKYSTIANSHTQKLATAQTKSSHSSVSLSVVAW
jgi:hypothetical protein